MGSRHAGRSEFIEAIRELIDANNRGIEVIYAANATLERGLGLDLQGAPLVPVGDAFTGVIAISRAVAVDRSQHWPDSDLTKPGSTDRRPGRTAIRAIGMVKSQPGSG